MPVRALVFFLVCFAVHGLPIGPGFSELVATAELSNAQLLNSCSDDGAVGAAVGAAVCHLTREMDLSSVFCQVSHNIADRTEIQVFDGIAGTEGSLLFSFTFDSEDDDNEFYAEDVFALDQDDDDTEEADFLSGNWYILISSEECPNGAIRGQLTNGLNVYSILSEGNEPVPTNSRSRGIAVADFNTADQRLQSFIQFDTDSAIFVQLLQATDSRDAGDVFYTFPDRTSPVEDLFTYIEPRETELYRKQHYYNVVSNDFLLGEIRGQLHVVDPTPDVNYAFLIRDSDDDSPLRAGALVSLLCNGEIEYFISHSLDIVDAFVIDDNNDFLFNLNGVRSPIMGKQQLSNDEIEKLLQFELTVVLQDTEGRTFTSEIRPEFLFYSYISGAQQVPHVNTFSRGMALFAYDDSTDQLVYHVFHNINGISDISIGEGDFGVPGPLLLSLPDIEPPVFGAVSLSEDFLDIFFEQELFISLSSSESSEGPIRGQILFNGVENCFVKLSDSSQSTYTGYYISSRYFPAPDSAASTMSWSLLFGVVFIIGLW
uniref:CHRD domain-containing protein n=1 Tax=Vannella robusta TaxID=1487602 RepID=A0A7S4I8J6_9EUKA|mmetsp:Transcript_21987/g.28077  ORF Transcript_21987/g.28077 Transcript_21987/m.28077 type:complete len:542 (+) Transcript_21987:2-1627(+)